MTLSTAPVAVRVAGAACSRVRDLLAGPERAARVVHVGAHAAYLDVDGSCLGVLSSAAHAVPCGISTLLPGLDVRSLAGPRPGHDTPALVGAGAVRLGGAVVVVGRLVDVAVPPLSPATAAWAGQHLSAPDVARRFALREVPADAAALLAQGRPGAADCLVGLGGGLTPLGDDVLAGWLAAMVAASHPARHDVAARVASLAPTRTTLLSATLLACAVRGEVLPEFGALVSALARREHSAALDRLAAVGHTSGQGLALGLSLALPLISEIPLTRRSA